MYRKGTSRIESFEEESNNVLFKNVCFVIIRFLILLILSHIIPFFHPRLLKTCVLLRTGSYTPGKIHLIMQTCGTQ